MSQIDYAVIALYFLVVLGIGFWYRRRASRSLQSYFLAGKSMHWLALAMSGAVSNFDISGTMWIVTLIYLFGMKSMWNHWMWGFLMGAFFMSFMGKWVRRSNVMTGAEWMVTRFGTGHGGTSARLAYTLMAVVTLTAFTAYAFQGIGKFGSEYVDLGLAREQSDLICALAIFAITTLYVLVGGLYSVVVTNVIQTVILSASAVLIAVVAYTAVTPEMLTQLPSGWTSLAPSWRVEVTAEMSQAGYAGYHLFGALVVVWVVKGLLLNLGGPGQMYDFQCFLAAKDARDAAKLGAAWSGFLIVRWAMCMGIALLAVTGLVTAAQGPAQPFDAERVMPAVLRDFLWPGVRGLVIAGLLAAFMSTFAATVNSAASYVVRDLWQPLVRPRAGPRELVWAGYGATIAVVVAGTLIGLSVPSIGRIFSWIMMELGAAFVIPNVLRWYWWRINGWGYAAGTLIGLAAAVAVPLLPGDPPLYLTFPGICALSLLGCLAGTWLSRPTDQAVLVAFFRQVRPLGAWGPIRAAAGLAAENLATSSESLPLAVLNVLLGCVAILGVYLAPMYLVGHWHLQAAACLAAALAAAVPLYFTWYRTLPAAEETGPHAGL